MNNTFDSPGGVSCPLYHCVFNQGSITHYMHETDSEVIKCLPNLYAVCLANNVDGKRCVVGGFYIQTTYSHRDTGFPAACKSAISMMPELTSLLTSTTSLLPAKVTVGGVNDQPLSEDEMTAFIFQQYFKFHEVGHC